MEMLARSTSPLVASVSACRPFRLWMDGEGAAPDRWCEVCERADSEEVVRDRGSIVAAMMKKVVVGRYDEGGGELVGRCTRIAKQTQKTKSHPEDKRKRCSLLSDCTTFRLVKMYSPPCFMRVTPPKHPGQPMTIF